MKENFLTRGIKRTGERLKFRFPLPEERAMRKSNRKTYLIYTGIYLVLFFSCFEIYLLRYHKSILWKADTFEMHYMQFLYLGRWVRQALATRQFPFWDPSIGYGADFFNSMPGFFCDPLNWIAIFFPERYAEYGFQILVVIKLYLCGLSFTWFGLRKGQPAYAVLCGAVIYTFCSCAYTGMYQSTFLLPMVLLPPLLIGSDELFEKNRSVLYVASLSLCAVISFYFTYMMAVLLICYFFLKWILAENMEKTVITFFRMAGRFLLYSFWSAMIAMVSLYPCAKLMTGMSRLNLTPYIPLFYSKDFYAGLFKGFINSYNMMHRDAELGFSVLAPICVLVLFLASGRRHRPLRIVFLLMSLGLAIPYVGHIMNGFGYVANRWVWAYAFVVSWICTLVIPELKNLSVKQKTIVSLLCLLYVMIAVFICRAGRAFMILSAVLLAVCISLFFLDRLSEPRYRQIMVALSCVTVILPAYFQYSPHYADYFGDNLEAGTAYEKVLESQGMPLLNLVDTSDGTRFNAYGLPVVYNAPWLYGVSGINYYLNMYNSRLDDFHNSIALHTGYNNFTYNGLDRRSELLALMGVNHFFVQKNTPDYPLGFGETEAETVSGELEIVSRKPDQNRSLFSRFTKTLSLEEYETLTPAERQQALLQTCVLDEDSGDTDADFLDLDSEEISYRIACDEGMTLTENTVLVSQAGSGLTLSFSEQRDGELYLCFDNLRYEYGNATNASLRAEALSRNTESCREPQRLSIGTPVHHLYGGKHNWILNFGVLSDSVDEIRIVFDNAGTWSWDAVRVQLRGSASAARNMERLNHDVSDVSFSADQMNVTVDNREEEYLFVSVPWDEGWTAYDNGSPAAVRQADLAFMAVKLEPGHHEIMFRYHNTPLIIGFLISFTAAFGYAVFEKKKRGRAKCRAAC